MEKFVPHLPEPQGAHNEALTKWVEEQYMKGWQYIKLPEIIKEHNEDLKKQEPVDFSEFDYSPGDGFF